MLPVKYLTYPEIVFGIHLGRCLEWKAYYEWDASQYVTGYEKCVSH